MNVEESNSANFRGSFGDLLSKTAFRINPNLFVSCFDAVHEHQVFWCWDCMAYMDFWDVLKSMRSGCYASRMRRRLLQSVDLEKNGTNLRPNFSCGIGMCFCGASSSYILILFAFHISLTIHIDIYLYIHIYMLFTVIFKDHFFNHPFDLHRFCNVSGISNCIASGDWSCPERFVDWPHLCEHETGVDETKGHFFSSACSMILWYFMPISVLHCYIFS